MPWLARKSDLVRTVAATAIVTLALACRADPGVQVVPQGSRQDDAVDCVTGDEHCACFPNSTCNGSLRCVDDECRTNADAGEEPDDDAVSGADDDRADDDRADDDQADDDATDDDGTAPDDEPVDDDVTPDDDDGSSDDAPAPADDDEVPDDVSFGGDPPMIDDDVASDDDVAASDDDVAASDDDVALTDDDVASDDDATPTDDDGSEPLPDDDVASDDDVSSVPAGCGEEFEVSSDGFVRAPGDGDICWYGYAWSGTTGSGSTITPDSFSDCGANCQLCASGIVPAADDYSGGAWIGFNIREEAGGALPQTTSISSYITVDFTNSAGSPLRAMIQGPSGSWCRELTYSNGTDATMAEDFDTQCWDGGYGEDYRGEPIESFLVFVPGNALEDIPYDFCITRVEN